MMMAKKKKKQQHSDAYYRQWILPASSSLYPVWQHDVVLWYSNLVDEQKYSCCYPPEVEEGVARWNRYISYCT